MKTGSGLVVSAAVEGRVDEVVCRRIIASSGFEVGPVHVKHGKSKLLAQLPNYALAAKHTPWLALADLDQDFECAPGFLETYRHLDLEHLLFRVAVRQVEAWLLADRSAIAEFLAVSEALVPLHPDTESHAKDCMLRIAAKSRKRSVREGLLPREGSGRKVGPLYDALMIEFASRIWVPDRALGNSDSLARCVRAVKRLRAPSAAP